MRGSLQVVRVRNSHCAPLGQPTNWSKDPKLPTSYIGLNDELLIEFQEPDALEHDHHHPFHIKYENVGVLHTGTGGARSPSADKLPQLGWDCRIFFQDLPRLQERVLQVLPDLEGLVGTDLNTLETFLNYNQEDYPGLLGHPEYGTLARTALEKGGNTNG